MCFMERKFYISDYTIHLLHDLLWASIKDILSSKY